MRQYLKHNLSKDHKALLLRIEHWLKLLTKPKVIKDLWLYKKAVETAHEENGLDPRFSVSYKDLFPVTGENTPYTSFDRHYVYHTSWAARVVKDIAAKEQLHGNTDFRHIDISSTLYFCGIVSAFIPVDFYDYRPADLRLDNLNTKPGDLMNLPFADASIRSISCMHTIEHVGLGRYGDPIDVDGDIKAINELKRVVAKDGSLIIVVPVGVQKIEFNAHRIYEPAHIQTLVCESGDFELVEYAFIPETDKEGGILRNAHIVQGSQDHYACGCFWFKKIK
ncbi:MAG: hypothetical protein RIQ72_512 [Candidatus Parcubacteria bacterium]|jgi:SAM-dependent methyltransferase